MPPAPEPPSRNSDAIPRFWVIASILVPLAFIIRNLQPDNLNATWYYAGYIAPIYAIVLLVIGSRVSHGHLGRPLSLSFDGIILIASAMRMFPGLYYPPFSGHALFLSYILISTRSWPIQVITGGYLAGVIIIKFDNLHLSSEWTLGLSLGVITGLIFRFRPTPPKP